MTELSPGASDRPPGRRPSVDVVGALPPVSYGTWALAGLVLLFGVQGALSLAGNPNLGWPVVGQYLFDPLVLRGVAMTLLLTALAMSFGIVLGGILSACRMSGNGVLQALSFGFVWLFRGTPLLVQIIFWFNIALVVPRFTLGLPFGPAWFSVDANSVVTPLLAAVVGLGLHEAAYQAEIYRAGLLSVGDGQVDAAKALGMKPARIFCTVRLPQAMRFIVPPTFGQVIGMTKGTAIVSVIGGGDLLFSVQEIYGQTFQTIPLLIVASVWYLAITTGLNVAQYAIERYYERGVRAERVAFAPSLWTTLASGGRAADRGAADV